MKYKGEKTMSRKQRIKRKLLFVEDGSVDIDELQAYIDEHNLPIHIVVYRQGAPIPIIKEL